MRIVNINVKNFRQLKDIQLELKKETGCDLHIFIGKNGAGKSNLMNAVSWCLYEEEPHLSLDSKNLPLINLDTLTNSEVDDIVNVKVELWIETSEEETIAFNRKANYKIIFENGKKGVSHLDTFFEVRVPEEAECNIKILEDDEAKNYVERFVPVSIREFFFFDGERLDSYFKTATGEKIKQAIFRISQLDLLELLNKRFDTLSKDISREAARNNPDLEKINSDIECFERDLEELEGNINNCKEQIEISNKVIRDCNEYLAGMPDAEELEKSREQLNESISSNENRLKEKRLYKKDLLYDYSIAINLYPAIKKTIEIIKEKRDSGELPPQINVELLKETLEKNHCLTCNKELDENSYEYVKNLIGKFNLSSQIGQELQKIEAPLSVFLNKIDSFEAVLEEVNNDIRELEKELEKKEKQKKEIESNLDKCSDVEKIKEMNNRRKEHEELKDNNQKKLGHLEEQHKVKKNELNKKYKEREKALEQDKKQEKLNKQFEFINNAKNVVEKSKESIMEEIRKQIEYETKKIFFNLIWKKQTFKEVIIDEGYNMNLIHYWGYDCLGSISAAERELLALSFTLALHRVSGFESPIIIDTPVARVSDTNRENFAEVLREVSKGKQTLLLFTPDEYSDNVKEKLDHSANSKWQFDLSDNEIIGEGISK